ncbi:growth-regulating factor 1 isoform X3 [Carica papaya]|uniref:growth-regulating factor 1 isoform X3 n=1 Tax=Carica papaya TaxID=3649 RepID=UPI000B8C791A|nr:growth-regulating factor 1 isoform X3 [Carica papaya]
MSARNRFPFTASQWQELEHQALIFKYMVSGIPIPPDLLFAIKRSCIDSPLSSRHIGWNCFPMGLGRKIDPEPGRCRRTDGKKWRCSKEAYPDSKYCERHMHRGKNRSRKPVEVTTTTTTSTQTISSIAKTPSSFAPSSHSLSSISSSETTHHHHLQYPYNHHPFLYSHTSSSRSAGIALPPQDNTAHLFLESASYSQADTDYRYGYGGKEDEHAFFSQPSGTMRSFSGSSTDDSWQLTPLTMSSTSCSKQRSYSGLQNDYTYLQLADHTPKQHKHCYVLGADIKCEMPVKFEKQEEEEEEVQEPHKTVHRFFDEWPPNNRESWGDLDDKSSNAASISTTQLSISIPSSLYEFPIFSSRPQNGKTENLKYYRSIPQKFDNNPV